MADTEAAEVEIFVNGFRLTCDQAFAVAEALVAVKDADQPDDFCIDRLLIAEVLALMHRKPLRSIVKLLEADKWIADA